ncbi:NDT80 / PhoG like DNA-binding family [Geosmithia morbida]|uniref:NDT80 / PhoG like DNA-binding family n=1 Tax=Geosmithia morbida TaxID=1094350 RepID=A0A9P4YN39_9HYPO|nr:NDT80 / PhoG like DNA-binding family [Geosmithia morbida]KAF4119625.1 NDT80 / PhoG like DNA-binding family [Geosmithia morbida]
MPDLRGDPAPSSLWSNYAGPIHMSPRMSSSGIGPMEPGRSHGPASSSSSSSLHAAAVAAAARPRSEQDFMSQQQQQHHHHHQPPPPPPPQQPYPYARYPLPEPEPSQSIGGGGGGGGGYPTSGHLKRSFSHTQSPPAHQDMTGGGGASLRGAADDHGQGTTATGAGGGHDQKLLAFRRVEDKATIADQHGHPQQLEVSAQLHGMFFLSEMPSSASDGTALQPELTCYRRNLFQIGGSLMAPRGPLSAITESGQTVPVGSMEVTISAIESVDGNPVRLVVIPWKTPPPNSPEVSQAPDQEPPSLPLVPMQEGGGHEADGVCAYYAIGWRRLQFRIATANNGRRKELQQHFVLHLKVHGLLADNSKVLLTEYITAPIVVRGRSPRNFQSRKEIPLLGSSAGSRGQSLVETGMGVIAAGHGHMAMRPTEVVKPPGLPAPSGPARDGGIDMRVPRSSFTFEPPKGAQRPGSLSSSSYSWSPTSHGPLPQVSTSEPYPTTSLAPADMYPKVAGAGYTTESHDMPLQAPSLATPLPLISEEHQHQQPAPPPSMRHPSFSYVPSVSTPRQMPAGTAASSADGAVDARYVTGGDDRPLKRNTGPGGIAGDATGYRYGPYASLNAAALPQPYGQDPIQRDVYATAAGTRTTMSGAHSPAAAAAAAAAATTATGMAVYGTDGRASYAATPYDDYRTRRPDEVRSRMEEQGQGHSPANAGYDGQHRGSFDAMSHYSWNNP